MIYFIICLEVCDLVILNNYIYFRAEQGQSVTLGCWNELFLTTHSFAMADELLSALAQIVSLLFISQVLVT